MPLGGGGFLWERTPGTRIANQGPLVSVQVNDETDNLINGLNAKVSLSGTGVMTGLQTLFGSGTALLHGATVGQVQSNIVGHSTAVGGTADAIQVTMSPAITTWATNELIAWKSGGANTITAPTISKDAGGTTKIIKKGASAALAVGDTGASGYECFGRYNGTDLILLNPATTVSLASTTEVLTGTDAAKAVTPDALAALWETNTTDITDGATITIGEGHYFNLITSTTAITAFTITTDRAGREFWVKFNTSRTLTNNAAIEIVEGGASLSMVSGNYALIQSKGGGNVRVLKIVKADGTAVVGNNFTEYDMGAVAVSTTYTQAHGLGSVAAVKGFAVYYQNTTTEANWAVGDRVMFASASNSGGSAQASVTVGFNATNIYVVTGTTLPAMNNRTTGASAVITAANWKVIIRVYN